MSLIFLGATVKRKTLLFLSTALFYGNAFASDAEIRILAPYVTIFGVTSDAIEIQAKNTTFRVSYSVDDQAFLPLDIPFDVVSTSGSPLDYRLTLPIHSTVCRFEGEERQVENPTVRLDGEVWPEGGALFNGALKSHVMRFSFPVITQKNTHQECYGVVGVRVEVATI
ncbi:hypothetical protein [Vibrio jasicida]|uniref:hypothetical protein n=1 Tax=Vibrio jasicida TaxID=766224 RepID=UPI0005EF50A7|nr:hypothetical protein [Vibrio jasicida]